MGYPQDPLPPAREAAVLALLRIRANTYTGCLGFRCAAIGEETQQLIDEAPADVKLTPPAELLRRPEVDDGPLPNHGHPAAVLPLA